MSCLRIILRVTRKDLVRSEVIYDKTGTVPVLNHSKPVRSDSWAIDYGALMGNLISNYALYHPTHGRRRPGLGRKMVFHGYAA